MGVKLHLLYCLLGIHVAGKSKKAPMYIYKCIDSSDRQITLVEWRDADESVILEGEQLRVTRKTCVLPGADK